MSLIPDAEGKISFLQWNINHSMIDLIFRRWYSTYNVLQRFFVLFYLVIIRCIFVVVLFSLHVDLLICFDAFLCCIRFLKNNFNLAEKVGRHDLEGLGGLEERDQNIFKCGKYRKNKHTLWFWKQKNRHIDLFMLFIMLIFSIFLKLTSPIDLVKFIFVDKFINKFADRLVHSYGPLAVSFILSTAIAYVSLELFRICLKWVKS